MAKKLLVADDSLTIQKVIKLALSGDGYEIQTVSDGSECLQQIALFRPDVVLIDVGLPGRSAFDIKKAANEDPDMSRLPFVLMSSAFEKVDEAKVALLRFDGRLTKPFDPSNLKEVLNASLKMNSGETIKEFTPPPPPSQGFSLEPSERSKQMTRPMAAPPPRPTGQTSTISRAPLEDDVTGEIRLADPSPHGSGDPLWNDQAQGAPADDNDIRHLTESTVKMSGLDDLGGWNINEGAKTNLPPIPDIFGSDGNTRATGTISMADIPFGASKIISAPGPAQHVAPAAEQGLEMELNPPAGANAGTLESVVEKQVREQLEGMVQGAVREQLEAMAKKALPEIAERVVKQEIRKLLEGLGGAGS
jgi:CheY-like chemotaxis protein